MPQFNQNVELLNASGVTILLTHEQAEMLAGGNGTFGVVRLFNTTDDHTDPTQANVSLDGAQATVTLGGQTLQGRLVILNASGNSVISARANGAELRLGGNGEGGDLYAFRQTGDHETLAQATVHLDGQSGELALGGNGANGTLRLLSSADQSRVRILGGTGDAWLGGNGADGDLLLFRSDGDNTSASKATIRLDGQNGDLHLGGNGINGDILVKDTTNKNRIRVEGAGGNIWLGGNGADGDLVLFRNDGDNSTLAKATIHLDGQEGNLWLGGNRTDGDIVMKDGSNRNRIRLDADGGNLWLGGNGADGDIVIFRTTGDNNTTGKATLHLDGQEANLWMGGNGADGDIVMRTDKGKNTIRLDAGGGNLWMGGNGADGDIVLFKSNGDNETLGDASIHLNGESGNIRCNDVIIPGADFAEDFDIHASIAETVEPGTVMVLGPDGTLMESSRPFDRKVAGVVSGAGSYKVGITLDKQPNAINRKPIALSGKVYCKVDAAYGSIEIGDLITSSPRKGYAMKASDPVAAFGAVIGKALADLPEGAGLIPILVALQ